MKGIRSIAVFDLFYGAFGSCWHLSFGKRRLVLGVESAVGEDSALDGIAIIKINIPANFFNYLNFHVTFVGDRVSIAFVTMSEARVHAFFI
ncbi:hypothetical protein ACWPKS_06660 [Coraliomargarita sp. W4R72]